MTETRKTQVAVLGAGPGGYGAAFRAADLGLQVTMIDLEENPGGVCLYRGCIPSKALLHVAKVLQEAREAHYWGIHFEEPRIDLDKMRKSKNEVVAKLTSGLGQLGKARKADYIRGRANFEESYRLKIVSQEGDEQYLEYEHLILAAGSRPATIPHLLIDSPRVMNSSSALQIQDIPKSMLVIGGGYIGLELGSVYATLGTKITVVEMMDTILPAADPDIVKVLGDRMNRLFDRVLLKTKVADAEEREEGIEVTLQNGEGKTWKETFDKVLVCVGRKPNSSGLGLQSTRVELTDRGFVLVDEQRRTKDPRIFAIGDIVGEPMLAHKATHEGRVAAEVISGRNVAFQPNAIPAVVFTDPEVAWVGLTEREAQEREIDVEVGRFPWGASGRATTIHRVDGLTKILTDPGTGQVLGMAIVGSGAGELIAQGALAIEMGATAEDIELTIHPHPTLSETVMETAELIFGQSTHLYRPKRRKGKNE